MIPKYEAIAADIRRSIEDGALKPGDKLPTVVEFCELYSVCLLYTSPSPRD